MIHVPKYSYQWPSKRLYQIRRAANPSPVHPDRTFVLEVAILLPAKDPAYYSARLSFYSLGDLREEVRSLRSQGARRTA